MAYETETTLRTALLKWIPPWLSPRGLKDKAFRILYGIALIVDAAIQSAIEAVEARLPGIGTFTALYLIGRDRRIKRGRAETDAAFAERLKRWRYDWQRAGNPYAIMRQLQGYVYPKKPRMRIVNEQGTWYTLNTDGTVSRIALGGNWDWDTQDEILKSRFWIIIYSTGAEAPWSRDGTWNDGEVWGTNATTWGSTATADQVADIRSIVSDFKSATGLCQNIIICFDNGSFDPEGISPPNPDGLWGNWSKNVGGVQVASRDPDAIYWDGVA